MYYQGNHAQAIAHAQAALRTDPDYILARTLLRKVKLLDATKDAGNEAFKANKFTEAIEKYTECMAIDPENETFQATVLSNRATAFLKVRSPFSLPLSLPLFCSFTDLSDFSLGQGLRKSDGRLRRVPPPQPELLQSAPHPCTRPARHRRVGWSPARLQGRARACARRLARRDESQARGQGGRGQAQEVEDEGPLQDS